MKRIILAALLLVVPALCFATDLVKIGFRAYSSAAATPTECGVFGMGDHMRVDAVGKIPIQAFVPDPDYSRTLSLGTKGYANYSTVYAGRRLTAIQFTCRTVGTSVPVPVKVYLNGVETYFLTLDKGEYPIGY